MVFNGADTTLEFTDPAPSSVAVPQYAFVRLRDGQCAPAVVVQASGGTVGFISVDGNLRGASDTGVVTLLGRARPN
jgi:hypothetical protein